MLNTDEVLALVAALIGAAIYFVETPTVPAGLFLASAIWGVFALVGRSLGLLVIAATALVTLAYHAWARPLAARTVTPSPAAPHMAPRTLPLSGVVAVVTSVSGTLTLN